MAMISVGEALGFMIRLEESLAQQYREISDNTSTEVVRKVANYLANHYKFLADALRKLPDEQYHNIKNATIPFGPQIVDLNNLLGSYNPDTQSVDSMINAAINLNHHIADMYRQVTNQDVGEDIRELFENLAKFEELDEYELVKIKALECF